MGKEAVKIASGEKGMRSQFSSPPPFTITLYYNVKAGDMLSGFLAAQPPFLFSEPHPPCIPLPRGMGKKKKGGWRPAWMPLCEVLVIIPRGWVGKDS